MSTALSITTPDDTTIILTRFFKAARPIVWEAISSPDKMKRWMLPPPGWTLEVCEVEPRLGGRLHLAWSSADANPAMTLDGEWTEWSPHTRMTHTEVMKLGTGETISSSIETHELAEQEGGTLMTITQHYETKEARDGALEGGMNEGMEACYRVLDGLVAS